MILKLKAAEILKVCSIISLDLYSKSVGQIYQNIFTRLMNSFEARNKNKIPVDGNTYIYTELSEEETTDLIFWFDGFFCNYHNHGKIQPFCTFYIINVSRYICSSVSDLFAALLY